MSENNKAVLKLANAAMAEGDTEGFLSHCTEDVEWNFVGDRTIRGKAAVRGYVAETYAKPPKFDISELIAENDLVTALGEITITSSDGSAKSYWYCDVWRFRNDKMAQLRAFVVSKQ
jgi:ketosteroid isomerase-like protein